MDQEEDDLIFGDKQTHMIELPTLKQQQKESFESERSSTIVPSSNSNGYGNEDKQQDSFLFDDNILMPPSMIQTDIELIPSQYNWIDECNKLFPDNSSLSELFFTRNFHSNSFGNLN